MVRIEPVDGSDQRDPFPPYRVTCLRSAIEAHLQELGDGLYAHIAARSGWGWSNAGLVVGEGQSLLVDTLFDVKLTRAMLDSMAALTAQAAIETVVNTHANGDHCYGNELLAGRRIVATAAAAAEMDEVPPQTLAGLMRAELGAPLDQFLRKSFGAFSFEGIAYTPPTETFSGTLELEVGGRAVRVLEVGPAHTAGDVLVEVPEAGAVFTGDILFIGSTPIVWAGPIQNWINACDRIIESGAHTIVPGHGPVTDRQGAMDVRGYLEYVRAQARQRHDAGMSVMDAARDIDLGPYADWGESERIVVNVEAVYRELDPDRPVTDVISLFRRMAEFAAA
jgi:cyclase